MEINYSNQSIHFLEKLEKIDYKRIRRRVERLKINPFSRDSKKIRKEKGYFRVRVGNFRITYLIERDIIYIVKIDKRERAYQ